MTHQDFTGQVAVVTGASQGIGRHLATAFAAGGGTVVGLARGAERLGETMSQIAGFTGAQTLALPTDVTVRDSVTASVTAVLERFGQIDLLVNNAGLIDAAAAPMWSADPDQWWDVVTSHVRGAFLTVHAVVPAMLERGSGRVVNLASGMGTRAEPDYSAYSVGKAAQIRLTEALAASLDGTPVRAFNIAPGLVQTEMTLSMSKWEGHLSWTPPERVVDLVCAVAAGGLDGWSGRFLRAGVDLPEAIAALVPSGADRQLRLRAYGPEDPMA